MKRIGTNDEDRLACEEPLGAGALYYGFLILAGIGLPVYLFTRGGSSSWPGFGKSGAGSGLEYAIGLALGVAWLLFTLRAVRGAFRRDAFVIDRRTRTIRTRSWWPFPPGHAKPLDSFNLVAVGEIAISGPLASSIPTRLTTVSLADSRTGKPLRLAKGDDSPMRTLAEDIARFIGFDLTDLTAREPVVTPVAEIGQGVPSVASRSEEPRMLRALPPQSTLAVSTTSGSLRVEWAQGNSGCFGLLACAVAGIFSVIVYTALHAESLRQWLIYPVFGGVALIVLLIAGSSSMPVRIILETSDGGLGIIRQGPFGKKRFSLRREAIRGFQTEGIAFRIRWDTGEWTAMGLSADEKTWLAEALPAALSARVALPGGMAPH